MSDPAPRGRLRVVRDRWEEADGDCHDHYSEANQRDRLALREERVQAQIARIRSDPRWRGEDDDQDRARRASCSQQERVLTADDVREMRRQYPVDVWVTMLQREHGPIVARLAERYGVYRTTIDQILRESSWCWVE